MFSRFRRRSSPEPPTERMPLLLPVEASEPLLVEVRPFGDDPCAVELETLSVAGAVVGAGMCSGIEMNVDDIAQVTIANATGEWSMTTAAVTTERELDDRGELHYTLEFVNDGNLFAQLGEAAGRWFNRRRFARARPELDAQNAVDLRFRHFAWSGQLFDVSETGFCATLDALASSPLRVEEPIEYSFRLPSIKHPFEGTGRVCNVRRMQRKAFVGVEFELESEERRTELAAYVERRLDAMAAFARSVKE